MKRESEDNRDKRPDNRDTQPIDFLDWWDEDQEGADQNGRENYDSNGRAGYEQDGRSGHSQSGRKYYDPDSQAGYEQNGQAGYNRDYYEPDEPAGYDRDYYGPNNQGYNNQNYDPYYQDAPKKKKGFFRRLLRTLILLLFLVIIAGGAFLYLDLSKWDAEKAELDVPASGDGNSLAPVEDDILFLLAGVDDMGNGEPQRTDTLMLVRMNFKDKKISTLSIPRDTRCKVGDERTKINHAYAYGGIDLTMETIRRFLGLDLDYYMIVDFDMVKNLVDAGGGVRYNVPEDAEPVNGEPYRTGDHVLDGTESLAYLRHRYGYVRGDEDRISAQQAFLKEIIRQLSSPTKIMHFPAMYSVVRNEAKTNIPALPFIKQLPALMSMKNNIDMNTLPGEGKYIGDVSYFIVESEEALDLVGKLFGPYFN